MSGETGSLSLLNATPIYKPFRYPWAFEAWQQQQRIHWLPEEVPLSEDVKDWRHNLSEGERNLLTQIFRFFTQADVEVNNCYRQGTEVLTPRGWVDFRNLQDGEVVAQVDAAGQTSFVAPIARVSQPAPSRMIRFHSERGVDVTVTPDHDMVIRRDGILRKVPATAYPRNQKDWQPMTSALRDAGAGMSEKERLLIAYQADARRSAFRGIRKADASIQFRFKRADKINRLSSIAERGGFGILERAHADGVTGLTVALSDASGLLGKDFSWVDLSKVGRVWCQEFVDELAAWDGHTDRNGHIQWRSVDEGAADMVQAIATLAGYRASKTFVDVERQHFLVGISTSWSEICTRRISRLDVAPEPGERVYCVTVPSGMLLVRSNGRVLVSGNCYMKHYSQVFKPTEVLMMMSAFSSTETIHIAAYSHLLDTIGMPEVEYMAFLSYKEMKDKYDYMHAFSVENKREIAKTLAAFGAFTEGLQLFASFAILMNFPRFNKMKGMGQIVSWSVRDETLHCLSIIRLFRTFIQENPEIWTEEFREELYGICRTIVEHEDAFINLAFEMGGVEGLDAEQTKAYIRFIANRRLEQIGLEPIYDVAKNPLPWLDEMLGAVEHTNFFENRATEYSRASTEGSWEDAFAEATFSG